MLNYFSSFTVLAAALSFTQPSQSFAQEGSWSGGGGSSSASGNFAAPISLTFDETYRSTVDVSGVVFTEIPTQNELQKRFTDNGYLDVLAYDNDFMRNGPAKFKHVPTATGIKFDGVSRNSGSFMPNENMKVADLIVQISLPVSEFLVEPGTYRTSSSLEIHIEDAKNDFSTNQNGTITYYKHMVSRVVCTNTAPAVESEFIPSNDIWGILPVVNEAINIGGSGEWQIDQKDLGSNNHIIRAESGDFDYNLCAGKKYLKFVYKMTGNNISINNFSYSISKVRI